VLGSDALEEVHLEGYLVWKTKEWFASSCLCCFEYMHCIKNLEHIFPEMNCAASFPISTFMYLWAIYIFPWSVLVLGRPILGIYKSLKDTWMWKLGDRTLWFCFENNKATQFHFWEYINWNQTFISDSHQPFICSMRLSLYDKLFSRSRKCQKVSRYKYIFWERDHLWFTLSKERYSH
jgi:hypothetical protein